MRVGVSGKTIIAAAAGFAAGIAATLSWTTFRPGSALTSGLAPHWQTATAQFDGRLRSRFPVGTPIQQLARELESQGFQPTWFEASGEYGAKRDEGDIACAIVARVYWRSADYETLSAIRGVYREEGCL